MRRFTALCLAVVIALALAPASDLAAGPKPRPFKATFKSGTLIRAQSHFLEEAPVPEGGCDAGPFAGADSTANGKVSHMGKTTAVISAAWDWGTSATGTHTPDGPVTGPTAAVLGSGHAFAGQVFPSFGCFGTNSWTSTGTVLLTAANGDMVTGSITGGEIYELGFVTAGDGQESFIEVEIVGGTGRFTGATGSYVLHSIINGLDIVLSEITKGGKIKY